MSGSHAQPPTLVLLPGLDGTGRLFQPFVEALPAEANTIIVSYPTGEPKSYGELLPLIVERLPKTGRFVLVGESFSGPLAVLAAATRPKGLDALVLCNTFVQPPRSRCLGWLPLTWLFRLPPPNWALRLFLVGPTATRSLCGEVRREVSSVTPAVLSRRVREVLAMDVDDALRELRLPIVDLRGTHDRLVPARCLEHVFTQRQTVTQMRIDGPHLLLQVAPRQCWSAIEKFLETTRE